MYGNIFKLYLTSCNICVCRKQQYYDYNIMFNVNMLSPHACKAERDWYLVVSLPLTTRYHVTLLPRHLFFWARRDHNKNSFNLFRRVNRKVYFLFHFVKTPAVYVSLTRTKRRNYSEWSRKHPELTRKFRGLKFLECFKFSINVNFRHVLNFGKSETQ